MRDPLNPKLNLCPLTITLITCSCFLYFIYVNRQNIVFPNTIQCNTIFGYSHVWLLCGFVSLSANNASNELGSWDPLEMTMDAVIGASWKGTVMVFSWTKAASWSVQVFAWRRYYEGKVRLSPWIWEWRRNWIWAIWGWWWLQPSPTILNDQLACQVCLWGWSLLSVLGPQVLKDQTPSQSCHSWKLPAFLIISKLNKLPLVMSSHTPNALNVAMKSEHIL